MMAATVSGVGLATTPIFSLAVKRISGTAITDRSAVSLIMAMNSLVRGGITSLTAWGTMTKRMVCPVVMPRDRAASV